MGSMGEMGVGVPDNVVGGQESPARSYREGMGERASSRGEVLDTLGRPIRDLRISVTDRCNFRCVYCMPKEVFGRDYQFLERVELLTFEEIVRVARIFVGLGVKKIRLTGGEPLVRRHIEGLIEMLAAIDDCDLALTTNGSMLARRAKTLKRAGLRRVTVSLDSLDDEVFRTMNDVDFPVARVLDGIETSDAEMPLEPVDPNYRGEVANRYRYKDGGGEIGIIASVTQPFCAHCTRVRLSAEGKLYTCLFANSGHDLRAIMRGG